MANVTFQWTWYRMPGAIVDRILDDKAKLFLANEAQKFMTPFVPADSLSLVQNVRTYSVSNGGVVEYNSPYAHYQFMGKLYVDKKTGKGAFFSPDYGFWSRKKATKKKTSKDLNYNVFRHPQATSHWDKAMSVAYGKELGESLEKYLRGDPV